MSLLQEVGPIKTSSGGSSNGEAIQWKPENEHIEDRFLWFVYHDEERDALVERGERAQTRETFKPDGEHVAIVHTSGDFYSASQAVDTAAFAYRQGARSVRVVCLPAGSNRHVNDYLEVWNIEDLYGEATEADILPRTVESCFSAEPDAAVANEASDDPHRLARIFRDGECVHADGLTLRYHRGEFYQWDGSAYREVDNPELASRLNAAIKQELDAVNEAEIAAWEKRGRVDEQGKPCGKPVAKKVTTNLVNNVVGALAGMTLVPSKTEFPAWLGKIAPFPAADVLPTQKTLVHLPTIVEGGQGTVKQTPLFFSGYSLPFDFDEGAPDPAEWLKFLKSVWPEDQESINTLQEWFGYCLTADTRQQKIMTLIGPKRAGKDTIARILRAMVGAENVAGPTLSSNNWMNMRGRWTSCTGSGRAAVTAVWRSVRTRWPSRSSSPGPSSSGIRTSRSSGSPTMCPANAPAGAAATRSTTSGPTTLNSIDPRKLRSDDTEVDWAEVASVDHTEARRVTGSNPSDHAGRRGANRGRTSRLSQRVRNDSRSCSCLAQHRRSVRADKTGELHFRRRVAILKGPYSMRYEARPSLGQYDP
jgi:hypothetical protein